MSDNERMALTVSITGATDEDFLLALDEVRAKVANGDSAGDGSIENGSYGFEKVDPAWFPASGREGRVRERLRDKWHQQLSTSQLEAMGYDDREEA